MPTYNPNIPQPTDILSDSQDDILENFQQLNTAWNVNHVLFNTANQGMHAQVTMPNNAAPTATAIGQANMWSQQSTLTATTELAWQRENAGSIIEWTGLLAATPGWTRLPSGILLKWGQGNSTGTGYVYTFPVVGTIPVFTDVFTIVCIPFSGAATGITLTAKTATNFTVNTFQTNTALASASPFYFIALGI